MMPPGPDEFDPERPQRRKSAQVGSPAKAVFDERRVASFAAICAAAASVSPSNRNFQNALRSFSIGDDLHAPPLVMCCFKFFKRLIPPR